MKHSGSHPLTETTCDDPNCWCGIFKGFAELAAWDAALSPKVINMATDYPVTRLNNPNAPMPVPKQRTGCCDPPNPGPPVTQPGESAMQETPQGELLQQEGLVGSGPLYPSYGGLPTGVPAPGGGEFVGPGGQAPPFAPGGPENPYPASAGMPPTLPTYFDQREEEERQRYGNIYSPPQTHPFSPIQNPPQPTQAMLQQKAADFKLDQQRQQIRAQTPQAAIGGAGVYMPQANQPPRPGQRPGTLPGQRLQQGFMARIIPVTGEGPGGGLEPGQPLPPQPPEVGIPGFPTPPINLPPLRPGERPPSPDVPGGPSQGPGFPTQPIQPTPPGRPESGQKPAGYKTLPMPKDHQPPEGPPKPPGNWVVVDAGRGQPPAWGFVTVEEAGGGGDTGLEPSPKKSHGGIGGYGSSQAGQSTGTTKPGSGQEAGHYVPLDVPRAMPASLQVAEEEAEPVWCWVPLIDNEYGVKHAEPSEPKPEPKK